MTACISMLVCMLGSFAPPDTQLPTFNKFGYSQARERFVLMTFLHGIQGQASLGDLSRGSFVAIDQAKAGFLMPVPLLLGDQFVLMDPVLKKVFYIGDDGSLTKTVLLGSVSPRIQSLRIRCVSVYDASRWLMTLQDAESAQSIVAEFSLETGRLTPWFTSDRDRHFLWYWVKNKLVRLHTKTAEVALVDPTSGRLNKLLHGGRDLVFPKKKPGWMPKLEPYARLGQVVYGPRPSVMHYQFEDDDPDRRDIGGFTFDPDHLTAEPLALLGAYAGRRLYLDWKACELVWGEP